MKRLISFILPLMIMGFIFVSCNDEQAPTASPENTSPVLVKSSESGAVIIKWELQTAFAFYDVKAGLRLIFGVDVQEWCSDGVPFETFNVRDIYLPNTEPNETDRIVSKLSGKNITASVWPWPSPSPGVHGGCEYYLNNEPIAVGTIKVLNTDNDVYAWARDSKNANSFGWTANGTLMGTDGKVYKLNFVYRYVWKWSWPEDGSKDNFIIKIQLTPTGKK